MNLDAIDDGKVAELLKALQSRLHESGGEFSSFKNDPILVAFLNESSSRIDRDKKRDIHNKDMSTPAKKLDEFSFTSLTDRSSNQLASICSLYDEYKYWEGQVHFDKARADAFVAALEPVASRHLQSSELSAAAFIELLSDTESVLDQLWRANPIGKEPYPESRMRALLTAIEQNVITYINKSSEKVLSFTSPFLLTRSWFEDCIRICNVWCSCVDRLVGGSWATHGVSRRFNIDTSDMEINRDLRIVSKHLVFIYDYRSIESELCLLLSDSGHMSTLDSSLSDTDQNVLISIENCIKDVGKSNPFNPAEFNEKSFNVGVTKCVAVLDSVLPAAARSLSHFVESCRGNTNTLARALLPFSRLLSYHRMARLLSSSFQPVLLRLSEELSALEKEISRSSRSIRDAVMRKTRWSSSTDVTTSSSGPLEAGTPLGRYVYFCGDSRTRVRAIQSVLKALLPSTSTLGSIVVDPKEEVISSSEQEDGEVRALLEQCDILLGDLGRGQRDAAKAWCASLENALKTTEIFSMKNITSSITSGGASNVSSELLRFNEARELVMGLPSALALVASEARVLQAARLIFFPLPASTTGSKEGGGNAASGEASGTSIVPSSNVVTLINSAFGLSAVSRKLARICTLYNSMGADVAPVLRPLLVDALQSFEKTVRDAAISASSSPQEEGLSFVDSVGLSRYVDSLTLSARALGDAGAAARRTHALLTDALVSLAGFNIAKNRTAWVGRLVHFYAFFAQQMAQFGAEPAQDLNGASLAVVVTSNPNLQKYLQHWDAQLWKVLVVSMRLALEALHAYAAEQKVSVSLNEEGVVFSPSLESLKMQHYSLIKSFLAIPASMRSLSGKSPLSMSKILENELFFFVLRVYRNSEVLFSRLTRLKSDLQPLVAVSTLAAEYNGFLQIHLNQNASASSAPSSSPNGSTASSEANFADTKDSNRLWKLFCKLPSAAAAQTAVASVRARTRAVGELPATLQYDSVSLNLRPFKADASRALGVLAAALSLRVREKLDSELYILRSFCGDVRRLVDGTRPEGVAELARARREWTELVGRREHARTALSNARRAVVEFEAVSVEQAFVLQDQGEEIDVEVLGQELDELLGRLEAFEGVLDARRDLLRARAQEEVSRAHDLLQRLTERWRRAGPSSAASAAASKPQELLAHKESLEGWGCAIQEAAALCTACAESSAAFGMPSEQFPALQALQHAFAAVDSELTAFETFLGEWTSLSARSWAIQRQKPLELLDFATKIREITASIDTAAFSDPEALSLLASLPDGRKQDTQLQLTMEGQLASPFFVERFPLWARMLGEALLLDRSVSLLPLLRGESFQDSHWLSLAKRFGIPKEAVSFGFTNAHIFGIIRHIFGWTVPTAVPNLLQLVSNANPQYQPQLQWLKDLNARAAGEFAVMEALREVQSWVASAELTLIPHAPTQSNLPNQPAQNTKIMLITQWRDVFSEISDKQSLVTALRESPFSKSIDAELQAVDRSLQVSLDALLLLQQLQKKWVYLEPVFHRGALPAEFPKFRKAETALLQLLALLASSQRLSTLPEVSNDASFPFNGMGALMGSGISGGSSCLLVDSLRACLDTMERCQKALVQWLDERRAAFPRFYFLGDVDLIEFLGQGKSELIVRTHLKKFFQGSFGLLYTPTDVAAGEPGASEMKTVLGTYSVEGEELLFDKPIDIIDDVCEWMSEITLASARSLQTMTGRCFAELCGGPVQTHFLGAQLSSTELDTSVVSLYSQQWVHRLLQFPSQVQTLAENALFCKEMEGALQRSAEGPRVVGALLGTIKSRLNEFLSQLTRFDAAEFLKLFGTQVKDSWEGLRHGVLSQSNIIVYPPVISETDQLQQLFAGKVKNLIFDVIHNIEVVDAVQARLSKEGSSGINAWIWQKQLRTYISLESTDFGSACLRMSTSEIAYSYEYQGVPPRLVHTALTDKCYLVLSQALQQGKGGNPYGPAGTGKTESVKALGQAVGRQVLVFNCDEALDAGALGRVFVGLLLCGAWGCFDEFNRLKEDQLSQVSQQIQDIQDAIKDANTVTKSATGSERGILQLSSLSPHAAAGEYIKVSPNSAIFVTLNPAGRRYGARSKLPDNLKALFRPVAMSLPDTTHIVRVNLYSEGFLSAAALASAVTSLFSAAEQLLSEQGHYDWGLRVIKSCVGTAGASLRARRKQLSSGEDKENKLDEASIVAQAIRSSIYSKFTESDAILFDSLIESAFPGAVASFQPEESLRLAVLRAMRILRLQESESLVEKVLLLHQALEQRIGCIINGPAGSGKSALWRILSLALSLQESVIACADNVPVQRRTKVNIFHMNPKSLEKERLLGYLDPDSREWVDGVLTRSSRAATSTKEIDMDEISSSSSSDSLQVRTLNWIVLDGDVDPSWVEALNSVLDDNRLLTLPNSERIKFGAGVNMIFETHDLRYASPATISRMGVVFLNARDLSPNMLVGAWSKRLFSHEEWLKATSGEKIDEETKFFSSAVLKPVLDAMDTTVISQPLRQELMAVLRDGQTDELRESGGPFYPKGYESFFNDVLSHICVSMLEWLGANQGSLRAQVPYTRLISSTLHVVETCLQQVRFGRHCNFALVLARHFSLPFASSERVELAGLVLQWTKEAVSRFSSTSIPSVPFDVRVLFNTEVVDPGSRGSVLDLFVEPSSGAVERVPTHCGPIDISAYGVPASVSGNVDVTSSFKELLATPSAMRALLSLAPLFSSNAPQQQHILLIGPVGSGAKRLIQRLSNAPVIVGGSSPQPIRTSFSHLSCTSSTDSVDLERLLFQLGSVVSAANGRVLRPKTGDRALLYVSDLQVVPSDTFGTVRLQSLLHQLCGSGGFYDTQGEFIALERIQIVCQMDTFVQAGSMILGDSTASTSIISPRLLASVHTVVLDGLLSEQGKVDEPVAVGICMHGLREALVSVGRRAATESNSAPSLKPSSLPLSPASPSKSGFSSASSASSSLDDASEFVDSFSYLLEPLAHLLVDILSFSSSQLAEFTSHVPFSARDLSSACSFLPGLQMLTPSNRSQISENDVTSMMNRGLSTDTKEAGVLRAVPSHAQVLSLIVAVQHAALIVFGARLPPSARVRLQERILQSCRTLLSPAVQRLQLQPSDLPLLSIESLLSSFISSSEGLSSSRLSQVVDALGISSGRQLSLVTLGQQEILAKEKLTQFFREEGAPLGLSPHEQSLRLLSFLDVSLVSAAASSRRTCGVVLLGCAGSGRKRAARLIAHAARWCIVFLSVARDPDARPRVFMQELKAAVSAAAAGEPQLLFLEDRHIRAIGASSSLVLSTLGPLLLDQDLSCVLSSEEIEALAAGLANQLNEVQDSSSGIDSMPRSPQELLRLRVAANLRVICSFDPDMPDFKSRCCGFPAFFRNCPTYWLGHPDKETLLAVATTQITRVIRNADALPSSSGANASIDERSLIRRVPLSQFRNSSSSLLDDASEICSVLANGSPHVLDLVELAVGVHSALSPSTTVDSSEDEWKLSLELPLSPTSQLQFEGFLRCFCAVLALLGARRAAALRRVQTGLERLAEAEVAVVRLSGEAEEKKALVVAAQARADAAMARITAAIDGASGARHAAAEIGAQVAQEEQKALEKQLLVQAELDKAQPMVTAALEGLGQIRKQNLDEIRSLKTPPPVVSDVMSAVCTILGEKSSTGTTDWNDIKKVLSGRSFVSDVVNLDIKGLEKTRRLATQRLLREKASSFDPDTARRTSEALKPLAVWVVAVVKYADVLEEVQPLQDALAAAQAQVDRERARMAESSAELARIDATMVDLKAEFAAAVAETETLAAQLTQLENTVAAAKRLLGGLAGERQRWSAQISAEAQGCRTAPLAALVAAADIVYLASYSEDARAAISAALLEKLKSPPSYSVLQRYISRGESQENHNLAQGKTSIARYFDTFMSQTLHLNKVLAYSRPSEWPALTEYSISELVSTERSRLEWRNENCPEDSSSLNVCVSALFAVCGTRRAIHLVDPSQTATQWLIRRFSNALSARQSNLVDQGDILLGSTTGSNDSKFSALDVVSATSSGFLSRLETAMRFGRGMVVLDAGNLESGVALLPLLRLLGSSQVTTVQFGEKPMEVHPGFFLVFSSRLANGQLPADLAHAVISVNLGVTRQGLTNTLKSLIIGGEAPDVEARAHLLASEAQQLRLSLLEEEEALLAALAAAGGDILSSKTIMDTVERASERARTVTEKLKEAALTQQRNAALGERFSFLAAAGAATYFAVRDAVIAKPLYEVSLPEFIWLFKEALQYGMSLKEGQDHDQGGEEESGERRQYRMRKVVLSLLTRVIIRTSSIVTKHERSAIAMHIINRVIPQSVVGGGFKPGCNYSTVSDKSKIDFIGGSGSSEWTFFIGDMGSVTAPSAAGVSSKGKGLKIPQWIPSSSRVSSEALASQFEDISAFLSGSSTMETQLSQWIQSETPETSLSVNKSLGSDWDNLGLFHRLLLVCSLRPDRFDPAVAAFLRETLGEDVMSATVSLGDLINNAILVNSGSTKKNSLSSIESRSGDKKNAAIIDEKDAKEDDNESDKRKQSIVRNLDIVLPDSVDSILQVHSNVSSPPILLFTEGGVDVSRDIRDLAASGSTHLVELAVGGGADLQQKVCEALESAASEGHWLLLKNVHLSPALTARVMDTLALITSLLDPSNSKANSNSNGNSGKSSNSKKYRQVAKFRLICSSEVVSSLPDALVSSSLKLMIEAPPGLRRNVAATLDTWSDDFLYGNHLPGWSSDVVGSGIEVRPLLLFALAWLLALMQDRRQFIPRSYSKFYEFSAADLRAGVDVIDNFCTSLIARAQVVKIETTNTGTDWLSRARAVRVPWTSLHGLIEMTVLGGRIDNLNDMRILRAYISSVFSNDFLHGSRPLAPGLPPLPSSISSNIDVKTPLAPKAFFEAFLQNLPTDDSAEAFGLPSLVSRTVRTIETSKKQSLMRLLRSSFVDGHSISHESVLRAASVALAAQPTLAPLLGPARARLIPLTQYIRASEPASASEVSPLLRFLSSQLQLSVALLEAFTSDCQRLQEFTAAGGVAAGSRALAVASWILAEKLPPEWVKGWDFFPNSVPKWAQAMHKRVSCVLAATDAQFTAKLPSLSTMAKGSNNKVLKDLKLADFASTAVVPIGLGYVFHPEALLTAFRQDCLSKMTSDKSMTPGGDTNRMSLCDLELVAAFLPANEFQQRILEPHIAKFNELNQNTTSNADNSSSLLGTNGLSVIHHNPSILEVSGLCIQGAKYMNQMIHRGEDSDAPIASFSWLPRISGFSYQENIVSASNANGSISSIVPIPLYLDASREVLLVEIPLACSGETVEPILGGVAIVVENDFLNN